MAMIIYAPLIEDEGCRYTVKVTQVNLPATAAGKWFLRKMYLQMQVIISAGNPNVRPQVFYVKPPFCMS